MTAYTYRDPIPVELDVCPVCALAVLDDPKGTAADPPVKMADGRWTTAKCEPDYWRAVETLASGCPPFDVASLDDYLGTATSGQAEYAGRESVRLAADPPYVNLRAGRAS